MSYGKHVAFATSARVCAWTSMSISNKQIGPRKELDIIFSLSSPFKGSVIVQCAIVVPMVHSWFSLLSNGIFWQITAKLRVHILEASNSKGQGNSLVDSISLSSPCRRFVQTKVLDKPFRCGLCQVNGWGPEPTTLDCTQGVSMVGVQRFLLKGLNPEIEKPM